MSRLHRAHTRSAVFHLTACSWPDWLSALHLAGEEGPGRAVVNKRFLHGVGKLRAHDKTTGTPVTNFRRSTSLYLTAMHSNRELDRDKDGIACEKSLATADPDAEVGAMKRATVVIVIGLVILKLDRLRVARTDCRIAQGGGRRGTR